MPQYLYRIQPTRPAMLTEGPTEREAQIVSEHFAYLQRLLAAGTLILAGRTTNDDPTSFGIVLFNVPDDAAAEAVLQNDPALIHAVMRGDLFPYRIALIAEHNIQPD